MRPQERMRQALTTGRDGVTVFLSDVGHGLLDVSHSMLAMVGLAVVAGALFIAGQDELRDNIEARAWGWLAARHLARGGSEELAAIAEDEPTTAGLTPSSQTTQPSEKTAAIELTRAQANVARWISRRYRVAPEPIAHLVQEAWSVGQRTGVEPTLILAVMAVESSFNPFAQSPVGAQGLMQVMTKIHNDKYRAYGGHLAAFDPASNLRVGVLVLKECIGKAGGLERGLHYYVGAGASDDDGGYASKVITEHQYLKRVAAGQNVPPTVASAANASNSANSATNQGSPPPTAQASNTNIPPLNKAEPDPHPGAIRAPVKTPLHGPIQAASQPVQAPDDTQLRSTHEQIALMR